MSLGAKVGYHRREGEWVTTWSLKAAEYECELRCKSELSLQGGRVG